MPTSSKARPVQPPAPKAALSRGRPSRRAAAELSSTILDAALARFQKQGFSAATIDEIAADCHTAKHSIYRRFPSKEALFAAAVRRDREKLLSQVQHMACRSGDPRGRLRELCRQLLEILLQPGMIDLYRMSMAEAARFPVIAREFHESGEAIVAILMPVVIEGQEDGSIRAGDANALARHIFHAVISQALHFVLLGDTRLNTRPAREAHFELTWDFVLHGAATTR